MTEKVEIKRNSLKKLLRTYLSSAELHEDLGQMMDNGKTHKANQHIGAELEAGMQNLHEIEQNNPVIKEIKQEIDTENSKNPVEQLEEHVLEE